MEEKRSSDQDDYWLIQYQRLMDRKPQSLIDQVRFYTISQCCSLFERYCTHYTFQMSTSVMTQHGHLYRSMQLSRSPIQGGLAQAV